MFCNVKDDLKKVKDLRDDLGLKPEQLSEDLKSCLYMEAASFVGFWNVLLGYYMAKSMKEAMCKMCLSGNQDETEAEKELEKEHLVQRSDLTKKEKADVCFWLQFVTSLSNMGCPTGLGETPAPKSSSKHPFSSLMPPMRPPFYGNFCNPCNPPC